MEWLKGIFTKKVQNGPKRKVRHWASKAARALDKAKRSCCPKTAEVAAAEETEVEGGGGIYGGGGEGVVDTVVPDDDFRRILIPFDMRMQDDSSCL